MESGELIGNDPDADAVQKTAVCKSDCVILVLNRDVFEILEKKKQQKKKSELAQFLVDKIPTFLKHYSLYRLTDNAHQIFIERECSNNEIIINEG